ncbi:hypothetical protein [Parafrankia elaeagni]|uniref:hypothetical protein n=1 Tax=Parafrankia elaeagni TaxID=222534 RepID=UPI00039E61AA|nr:hypothetical protein [Parafrankia elaeagni]
MFDLLGLRARPHHSPGPSRRPHSPSYSPSPSPRDEQDMPSGTVPAQRGRTAPAPLPPSVARVAARTRLSAEILAAILAVDGRTRATLDDMERADALADVMMTRRRERGGRHRPEGSVPAGHDEGALRWSA